jgi:hypothetical protein
MPRVPTYESQILQPTIRQGEARQVITSEQATLPGRQMQEAGEAMGRVGSALGQYVLQRQNDLNEAQALDAFNQAERITQERVNEYEALSSLNAIRDSRFGEEGPISYYTSELSRAYSDITGGLNANVQERLRPRLFALQTQASDQLNRHFNAQSTAFETETYETSRAQAQQAMIASPDNPELVFDSMTRIVEAEARLGQMQGQDPETISLNTRNAISEAMATTHTGLLNSNNFPAAERFLEQYQSRFQPEALVAARNNQQRAGAEFYGNRDAETAATRFPWRENFSQQSEVDAFLREQATVDGVLDRNRYNVARIEFDRYLGRSQDDFSATRSAALQRTYSRMQTSVSAAIAHSDFNLLSPTQQAAIRNMRPRASSEQRLENATTLLSSTDYVERLSEMTREEVAALEDQLPAQQYSQIVADWNSNELARLRSVPLTGSTRTALREALTRLGLPTSGDEYTTIQSRARYLLGEEQARREREIPPSELESFFISTLGRDIAARSGTTRNVGEFSYTNIPRSDTRRIEAALGRVYQDASDANDPNAEFYNPELEENVVRQYLGEQAGILAPLQVPQ